MRRVPKAILAAAIAVCGLLLVAPPPASAACTPVPPRSSPAGRLRIRRHPVVVLGTVGAVPSDPHGAYSLTLNVRRYYAGRGPLTITITNYATRELHEGFERPRNRESTRASVDFALRFGGQPAVFFLGRDTALGRDTQRRYALEYATDACLYNVVGRTDIQLFRPLLDQIFSQPLPAPGATGLPAPGGAAGPIPTGTGGPRAAGDVKDESRSGPITRAAGLAIVVAASLLAYRNPRSPLFERWRKPA
ncbi:MAG: hypothetical protein ACRDJM_10040 [Actinomycetota bacterium]